MSVRSEYQTLTSTFDTKTNDKPVNIMEKMETQQASPSPTSDVIQQSPFIASSTSPTNYVLSSFQSNQNFPISNLEEAIRLQIEYYFSDANLANDKFLQSEMQKPEGEGQGYVTLELLSTFPKMRRMQADVAKIRESLKESTTLVLNGDGTKVKRNIPFHLFFPEATVYVSFLPNNLCTQQQLQTLFGSFGTIANIDIPTSSKDGKHEPRGIAFVQFSNKEAASALLQQFKQHFHELHRSGVRVKPYSKAPPVYATQTSAPIAIPQNSNQKSNRSPANSPSNRVSIYESTPTFNYSSSKGKTRKKRSDSKNDLESTWEPTSQSAEQRPKLVLKPRSASLPGPESTSPIAAPSTPGGIVPIRQPKGPDNTKGFHFGSGRGKLISTVS